MQFNEKYPVLKKDFIVSFQKHLYRVILHYENMKALNKTEVKKARIMRPIDEVTKSVREEVSYRE